MHLTFASHGQVFFHNAKNIKQIDIPTLNGILSLLEDQLVPLLASLQPGVVSVYENDGKVKRIFISSGNVSINQDLLVQIVADEAFFLDNFDINSAREELRKAQDHLLKAVNEIESTNAKIEIDCAEAIIKAIELEI